MKYKIGIISDTHNYLYDEVINDLKDCDYILHAGDIMSVDVLNKLQTLSQVIVVKGNHDELDLEEEVFFTIGGYRFYMRHQLGNKKDTDFYIFGHSHCYNCYREEGVQYINPGGCGRRRFSLPLTYVVLYITDSGYTIKKRILVM